MKSAATIKGELDALEAERAILTIQLRNALIRAAAELLPEAIRQAKTRERLNMRTGKSTRQPGSPALLRLITRLAMRPLHLEPRKKER